MIYKQVVCLPRMGLETALFDYQYQLTSSLLKGPSQSTTETCVWQFQGISYASHRWRYVALYQNMIRQVVLSSEHHISIQLMQSLSLLSLSVFH